MKPHDLIWFSAGAASAVAAKLWLSEHGHDNADVYYTDTGSEDADNPRFITDCEKWFGHEVRVIRSEKYESTWDVWERTRYLVGKTGARCTIELKKKPRWAIEGDYDRQIFGYTSDPRDAKRADRFRLQNPDVALVTPLIERGLTKRDCLAMIERAGIKLPNRYLLGFANNNCIGCVKGGIGYWNKERRHNPATFDRMAKLERKIGHSVLSDDDGPVWLDELDPARGRYEDEPDIECSLLCSSAEDEFAPPLVAGLVGDIAERESSE